MMEGSAARPLGLQHGLKDETRRCNSSLVTLMRARNAGGQGLLARARSTRQRGGLCASEPSGTINRDKLKYSAELDECTSSDDMLKAYDIWNIG